MLNVRGGAAGGACAKAPGAMVPTRATTASVSTNSFFMYLSSVVVGFSCFRESAAQYISCLRHAPTVLHTPKQPLPPSSLTGAPWADRGAAETFATATFLPRLVCQGQGNMPEPPHVGGLLAPLPEGFERLHRQLPDGGCGVDVPSLPEDRPGLVLSPRLGQATPKKIIGKLPLGLELGGLTERLLRLLELALPKVGLAEVVIGQLGAWVGGGGESPAGGREGRVELILGGEGQAEIVIGLGIGRLERDRLLERGLGIRPAPELELGDAGGGSGHR